MDKIFQYWHYTFYLNPFCLLFALAGFIVALRRSAVFEGSRWFPLLFLSFMVCQLLTLFSWGVDRKVFPFSLQLSRYSDFLETLIEFLIFTQFIQLFLKGRLKLASRVIAIAFFLCVGVLLLLNFEKNNGFIRHSFIQPVYTIQAFFLIGECSLFFWALFKAPPKENLLQMPSFWIVTGILFFMLWSLPFSIFGQYLMIQNYRLYLQLFRLFDVFYCLLFAMIIRAYYCSTRVSVLVLLRRKRLQPESTFNA